MIALRAIAGLFGMIPGWVYAILLAGAMLHGCHMAGQRDTARLNLSELTAAVEKQKAEAAQLLVKEHEKVITAERRWRQLLDSIETKDADHAKTITKLAADLRASSRAGGGPGLRDPNAPRCWPSGGSAETATAAAAPDRAASGAEAGGLISESLERLLFEQAESAELINRAYTACRQDSINIRSQP